VETPAETPPPSPRTPRELAARLRAERAAAPFLLFRDEAGEQRIVALRDAGRPLTLGRTRANDIAFPWDAEVSRVHAELEAVGGQWTLADQGLSRNGTFVGAARVQGRRRLRDGDAIRLGRTVALYCEPAPAGSAGATAPAAGAPAIDHVTPTQQRILAALCKPLVQGATGGPATNREIADAVHLSVDGVKGHMRTLFERFDVGDLPQNRKRLELAERALRWGLGSGDG
jgi:DNA-binding CsgD family transcriptional regulator